MAAKELIIVESPAKVKTIKKFLGKDFEVAASVGHVRDLPTRDLGVDEKRGFAPKYQIIKGKEEVVRKLRQSAAKADHVYLAPDPDREGEAIAWHVAEVIRKDNPNVSRIHFNEITARAVREALAHPRPIDENMFDSQQARRVLDRLVGYKISPILWTKVKRGISAGRVQSVALKLIVEREKERRAFVPEEYWPFKALLAATGQDASFEAELAKVAGKKPVIASAEAAQALEDRLSNAAFVVAEVQEKERRRDPAPPFITSTLQQEANRRLGFTSKRTMSVAQRLYEGVELGDRGTTALITYMRTDSVRVADEARAAAREFILERFGADHYPSKPRQFKTKGGAQDAHEAIRPVDPALTPEEVKPFLPAEQFKVYSLIWQRFVASQMAAARFWDTAVTVSAADTLWKAKGERLIFPGFLAAVGRSEDEGDAELPRLSAAQPLELRALRKEQKFTQPPARYSEATLVKELEDKGIGRPSTYAAIISTLQDRDYVRMEEKRFAPTELGFVVSDQLSEHFPALMDVGFTAHMETLLDDVAEGKENWSELIRKFAEDFYPTLEQAAKQMRRGGEDTGVVCELCGKPMSLRFGKTGEFLGCTGYPDCKNIKNFTRDEQGRIVPGERSAPVESGVACEKCGKPMLVRQGKRGEFLGCSGYPACSSIKNFRRGPDGAIEVVEAEALQVVGTCPDCGKDLVVKRSRVGGRFISCSGYPKCKYIAPFPTGVTCPREGCGGEIVEKRSKRGKLFFSCSNYPKCDFASWDEPLSEACPQCGHPFLVRKTTKAAGTRIVCPDKDCGYGREAGEAEDGSAV